MNEDCNDLPVTHERLAEAVHMMNRAYCTTIGDESQPTWELAPQWQKDSAIEGVKEFLKNPDLSPEEMHQKWYDFKEKDGWKYGPVKDVEKKEHPCMVTYDKLPLQQKFKDLLFQLTILAAHSAL